MKIVVKIEDIEVSYEENNYKTTQEQDVKFLNECVDKAFALYQKKTKEQSDE